MSKVLVFSVMLTLAACQSTPPRKVERSIANTTVLRTFLKEVAEQSRDVGARDLQQQIEKNLKEYIRQNSEGEHGNWVRMGITKDQAFKIESLYDDLPYMNKVQKWVMENVTTLAKGVKPSIASNAYTKIVGRSGSVINPYQGLSDDVKDLAMARRGQTMPSHLRRKAPEAQKSQSISDELRSRNNRLIAAVENLDGVDSTAKQYILNNLKISDDLVKNNPLVASNIHHSVEGSVLITKKTGLRSMGKGCESFNEKASGEILEIKARVDMRRAELIEQKAYDKAGKVFNSVDEIPADRRLSQAEIDEATEEAFEDVLGYSRKEAQAAIKRLKSPPCQVY